MSNSLPAVSEEVQENFFRDALAATKSALVNGRAVTFNLQIAGVVVELVFPNQIELERFTPALKHLEISAKKSPDASFYIWDSDSTGVDMPPPPCGKDRFTYRGDVWGFNSSNFHFAFDWGDHSVNLYDKSKKIAIYWTNSATKTPYWTIASPFRTLFSWLLKEYECQLVHGAAVGTHEGAVVITGKGGIGKSSTALSSLVNGMQFIGDDFIVVQNSSRPVAHCLYSSAKGKRRSSR